jgi:hypothetical protein
VAAGSVVKNFDVIEHISPGHVACFVDALADAFFLQAAEKGLGYSVILTITAPTHTRL